MSQLVLELVAFSFPVCGQYDGDYAYIVVLLIIVYLLSFNNSVTGITACFVLFCFTFCYTFPV